MIARRAVVGSVVGMHARPAAIFTQAVAAHAPLQLTLATSDGRSTNAASILGVLALGIPYGETVTLSTPDAGAEAVLDELVTLLERELDAD